MSNFTILLTGEQLEIIGQGLDELKFRVAAPVAYVIQSQINAELERRATPPKIDKEAVKPPRKPRISPNGLKTNGQATMTHQGRAF